MTESTLLLIAYRKSTISLADQADFAVAALVLLRPIWRWRARDAAEIVGVATGVHLVLNVVGYAIGARRSLL